MESTKTAKNILMACDVRVMELREIAQRAADDYWTMRLTGNEEASNRRKSNLGCRVVSRGTQFTVSWFVNSYNITGPKIETYSKHLRKGRSSFRYSDSVLRKVAARWEWKYVLEAETCFAVIREELNVLARIRRSLMVQKRVEEKLNQILVKDDVDW